VAAPTSPGGACGADGVSGAGAAGGVTRVGSDVAPWQAKSTLQQLGYGNVHVRVGDGYKGWPDKAPFDKIIVTCSPEKVPQPLVDQLAEDGLMIVPVGERYSQTLYKLRTDIAGLPR